MYYDRSRVDGAKTKGQNEKASRTRLFVVTFGLLLALLAAGPAGAIVGGNPTTPDQYRYYVRLHILKYNDRNISSMCGGSIIDDEWILTAAHCLTDGAEHDIDPPRDIRVYVLDDDRAKFNAVQAVVHPRWDGDATNGHDLALVRIPRCATDGSYCKRLPPGTLPEPTKVQVGAPADPGAYAANVIATMVGHGETYWGSGVSPELRDLHTPLHSDEYMDDIYNRLLWWDEWKENLMIGAGWTNHTACRGDSGGPLTVERNGVTVQVGVYSFWFPPGFIPDGESCAQPGAYAELSNAQLAWIAATVPGVAAGWGSCEVGWARRPGSRAPRPVGGTPGRWVATYSPGDDDLEIVQPDTWSFSCVPIEPDTMGSGIVPRGPQGAAPSGPGILTN